MTRVGLGLAAMAAAVLMLGATPALACGNEHGGEASCHCGGGAKAEAPKAEPKTDATVDTCGKDGASCACSGPAAVKPAEPKASPAPKASSKQVAPPSKPQSCNLHPGEDALAGKCSCGGPSDCTCKKNDCQCGKCKHHRAGEGEQGA